MIGLPFETNNTIRETHEFNRAIGVDVSNVMFYIPLPGTKLFDVCKQYNIIRGGEHKINTPNIKGAFDDEYAINMYKRWGK